jgi:Fe-S oxidoreductase/FAD/FMN-containing dehydrogenase
MAGKTVDNTEALEILTYDGLRMNVGRIGDDELEHLVKTVGRRGDIYSKLRALRDQYASLIRQHYPKIPRRVSGYNLDELLPENGFHVARALVGTEGTCVTMLEAAVRLISSPPMRALLVVGYPDVFQAGDDVAKILEYRPIGLEGLDEHFVRNMAKRGLHLKEIPMLPEGNSWLLAEFGGARQEEANEKARALMDYWKRRGQGPATKLFTDPKEQKLVWSIRESTFGASVFVPGEKDTYAGFEDSAVPPAKLGAYLRDLQKLYAKYDYYAVTYGHFGDGCIHTRISFDLRTEAGIKKYRAFQEEAADLVIAYGGSLSGEHGDGQTWGHLLPKMFGDELVQAFREFKSIWDPQGKMNPGKVVDAYRSDENLRLKAHKTIPQPKLHFHFPEEQDNFSRTMERCIGIGKCLKKEEGTMCPSFMATREEMHSTRGRAHLLYEMMRGEVLKGGWHDEHVKESLDLCLACKGCKNECPVSVDMATYKAEFLSHYYEGRLRPVTAYAFGLLPWWCRIASGMPSIANFFTQTPALSNQIKRVLGIARERQIPGFAPQIFKQWFQKRGRVNAGKPKVVLWPDTFNNYFHPEILQAACKVLEACGFQVIVPMEPLCCGRPLYDYGMLDLAKRCLQEVLRVLRPYLEQTVPMVGLEPSCAAVFRDELVHLFSGDPDAKRLSQNVFLFSEFLERNGLPPFGSLKLQRKAVIHGHCHQKAIMGMEADEKVLAHLGLPFEVLDSGCCGMAGAFGFEKTHYDVSVKIGKYRFIPALQNVDKETLVIADGFSCREQIKHLTALQPLHLAQVTQTALQEAQGK